MAKADPNLTPQRRLTANRGQLEDGKDDTFWWDCGDGALTGYALRVRRAADGRIVDRFYYQRRGAGRHEIGDPDKITETQGRALARKLDAQVELGGSPQRDRAEKREADRVTLKKVAEAYVGYKKASIKANSYAQLHHYLVGQLPGPHKNWRAKKNVNSWLRPYHSWPAHTVTNREVSLALKHCMEKSGGPSAIALKSAMSAMWTWAIKEGCYGITQNPVTYARDVDDEPDEERAEAAARLLSEVELVAIWQGVDPGSEFGKCVRLMVLTLCRRKEVGGAKWSDFDDPEHPSKWTFPNQETKTGKHRQKKQMGDHVLPVTSLMREIIATVHPRAGTDRLFGSVHAGNGFQSWSDGKAALDEKINIPRWKLHHIRRSVSTILGDMGTPPHVVEQILAHSSGGTRNAVARLYNRSRYETEVRAVLTMWSDHIAELVRLSGKWNDPEFGEMVARS
jgi:integrase